MKIKFSSICGVYDCSGAGVHYNIMQREEGAGERVFGNGRLMNNLLSTESLLSCAPGPMHCETRLEIGLSFQIIVTNIIEFVQRRK